MALDHEKHNQEVEEWGRSTTGLMISTGKGMGIQHRDNSPSKSDSITLIKSRFGFDQYGFINRVSFGNINRSLIYTTYGAGKGRGGLKGSRWIDKFGEQKKTKSSSLGKMGTAGRKAKPFIDKALDAPEGTEKLADIVAINQADAIVGQIKTT